MTALTDAEREALLTPCGCGHSINDHGTLCWVCADNEMPDCPHGFEELLVERLDGIVAGRVKARLAAVEALADEWERVNAWVGWDTPDGRGSYISTNQDAADELRDAQAAGADGGGGEGGGDA